MADNFYVRDEYEHECNSCGQEEETENIHICTNCERTYCSECSSELDYVCPKCGGTLLEQEEFDKIDE